MFEALSEYITTMLRNQIAGRTVDLPDGKRGVLVPDGVTMKEVSSVNDMVQTFIVGSFKADSYETFVDYISKFKDETSVILANLDASTFTCIFDFHAGCYSPGRLRHTATYRPKQSIEWKKWSAFANGGAHTQKEAVEFLEENAEHDIMTPPPAVVLEMVKNLELTRTEKVKSVESPHNGTRQVIFEQKDDGKGGVASIVIPETMEIAIPLYFGGPSYRIMIRNRYRLKDGDLSFHFAMDRIEYVKQAAFDALICDQDDEGKILSGLKKDLPEMQVLYGEATHGQGY